MGSNPTLSALIQIAPKRELAQWLEFERRVIELYDMGWSLAEVGQIAHCSASTVRRVLVNYGIPARTRTEAQTGMTRLPHEEITRTVFMYEEMKMSSSQIGEALGLSENAVWNRLVKAGVKRRTAPEAQRLAWANLSPEARAIRAKHAIRNLTNEQLSEKSLKAWKTRRQRLASREEDEEAA